MIVMDLDGAITCCLRKEILTRTVSRIFQRGEELLFMFVYGCIVAKRGPLNNRIPVLDELEGYFDRGEMIPHPLFDKAFSVAFAKLRAFIRDPLTEERWAFEEVLSFCRNHKGKVAGCDSIEGVVVLVEDSIIKIKRGDQTCTIQNHFKLKVFRGDWACTHKGYLYHVLQAPPS